MSRYDFFRPVANYDRAAAEGAAQVRTNITYDARLPEGQRCFLELEEQFGDSMGFAVIRRAILAQGTRAEVDAAWLAWYGFDGVKNCPQVG